MARFHGTDQENWLHSLRWSQRLFRYGRIGGISNGHRNENDTGWWVLLALCEQWDTWPKSTRSSSVLSNAPWMRKVCTVALQFTHVRNSINRFVCQLAPTKQKCGFAGEIQEKGMQVPFTRDIYRPMLQRLKQEGLQAIETAEEDSGYWGELSSTKKNQKTTTTTRKKRTMWCAFDANAFPTCRNRALENPLVLRSSVPAIFLFTSESAWNERVKGINAENEKCKMHFFFQLESRDDQFQNKPQNHGSEATMIMIALLISLERTLDKNHCLCLVCIVWTQLNTMVHFVEENVLVFCQLPFACSRWSQMCYFIAVLKLIRQFSENFTGVTGCTPFSLLFIWSGPFVIFLHLHLLFI